MTRYTSRNHPALARIREQFNGRIYDQARRKLNEAPTEEEGREAVREHIRQFFNDWHKHRADEIVDGTEANIESSPVECGFCGSTVQSHLAAMVADWVPSFDLAVDGDECACPTCPACQEKHLDKQDGVIVIKPGHEQFVN